MSSSTMTDSSSTMTDAQAFEAWLNFALEKEGKFYEDVRGDAGGPTKWGITWIDYNAYRKGKNLRPLTISEARATRLDGLTEEIIRAIYKVKYWDKMQSGLLPSPLDMVIVDAAVNCGPSQATKWAERIVGLPDDGRFDNTLVAGILVYVNKHGQEAFIAAFDGRREAFYKAIGAPGKTNNKFLKGWLARVADLSFKVKGWLK